MRNKSAENLSSLSPKLLSSPVYIYVYIQACVVHGQAAVFLQGAGRQIGVLVFDLAIEGKPPFIFVVGEKRFQREHFAQRETWPH